MLRTIHLHGALKKKFGPSYELDCVSAQEAAQALGFMVEGFQQMVVDGVFRVILGDRKTGYQLPQENVAMNVGKVEDIHIIPVPHGSKRNGIGKLILGIALVGLAFVPGVNMAVAGAFGSVGASVGGAAGAAISSFGKTLLFRTGFMLALGGAYQVIAGTPKTSGSSNDGSFLFSGATNTSEQGAVMPVVFGRYMVGSIVVSGGITPEEV